MTKNVSAGGGRGGRADRNLWRFVAHLEADIFLQLVGSLQILLILHLFFAQNTKQQKHLDTSHRGEHTKLISLVFCREVHPSAGPFPLVRHQILPSSVTATIGAEMRAQEDFRPFQASRVTDYIHLVCR